MATLTPNPPPAFWTQPAIRFVGMALWAATVAVVALITTRMIRENIDLKRRLDAVHEPRPITVGTTAILDSEWYRGPALDAAGGRIKTGRPVVFLVVTKECSTCKDAVVAWTTAIKSLPPSARPEMWVASAVESPADDAVSELASQAAGHLITIRDSKRFAMGTGITAAPMSITVTGGLEVQCVLAGAIDSAAVRNCLKWVTNESESHALHVERRPPYEVIEADLRNCLFAARDGK